jgi:hypothetical protein
MSSRPERDERRRFGRRRCRVHGWVHLNLSTRIPCVMTDYSVGGARLQFSQSMALPHRFYICFDGFLGAIRCEVRHTVVSEVGVEFCQARSTGPVKSRQVSELLEWLAPQDV